MGSATSRRTVPVVALLILLVVPGSAPAATEGQRPAFAGAARDTLGQVLEGVEVLLVTPERTSATPSVAHTDGTGRFYFPELLPDRYNIAAVKDGYLVFVGQVDTKLQKWIDLVLRPAPPPGAEPGPAIPEDPAWAMRLPQRNILRDTEPPEDVLDDFQPSQPSMEQPLHVRVDQLVAMRSGAGGASDGSALHGTQTRVSVATSLGGTGSIRVSGAHGSLRTSENETAGTFNGRDTTSLDVVLAYDTSVDSHVGVRAFFDRDDLRWAGAIPSSSDPTRRERRRWGYDAQWTKSLGNDSDVSVVLDYRDTFVALPALDSSSLAPLETEPSAGLRAGTLTRRAIATAGRYHFSPGRRHSVDFSAQARLIQTPYESIEAAFGRSDQPLANVNLALDAQDAWRIAGPVSVVYGVGYRQGLHESDASWTAPRVGARLSSDEIDLGVSVSYYMPSGGPDAAAGGAVAEERVGYRARMRVPLSARLDWVAASSYSPVEMTFVQADEHLRRGFDPTDLSDGNASTRRHRVGLAGNTGAVRTFFEVERGTAVGKLATLHVFDSPLTATADRRVDFNTGRLGVSYAGSGTDVIVQYDEIAESTPVEEATGPARQQRSLEVGVSQNLLRMENFGSWRLLMAVRMFSLDSETDDSETPETVSFVLEPAGELSVGLSVAF